MVKRTPGAVVLSLFGKDLSLRYGPAVPTVDVSRLKPFAQSGFTGDSHISVFGGDKFAGGFGATHLFQMDYWTLRARSAQLFTENHYARGIIRRLVTNEINTGLAPDSSPDEDIIGVAKDSLLDWTETVENRFALWGKAPGVCDWRGESTFGAIQRIAKMEAYICGDLLVVMRQSPITNMPQVQLVDGNAVQTPWASQQSIPKGHRIKHGVELDAKGRVFAYWVRDAEGKFDRILANGKRTGRRMAWLVFGTDKRLDDVRGMPLLSIMLQSLKEIDRYRDSAQRKAVINSILAMFIKKGVDKPGTMPTRGGGVRHGTATATDGDGSVRDFNITDMIPGLVVEELQVGEEPIGFHSQGTDINFPVFEEAVLRSISWALEIPPEILVLAFTNNYSASQAAINEFKIYLNMRWSDWGETFCTPIFTEVLISDVLLGKVEAAGLLEAWTDPAKWDIFGAWTSVAWYGSIKPSTDMLKQAKGSKLLVDEAWSTNAREARMNTGTKFTKNVAKLKRENEQKVEAMRPMAEFHAEFVQTAEPEAPAAPDADAVAIDDLCDAIDAYLEERGVGDGS